MIVHPVGKYYASAPSLADGEMKHLRVTSDAHLLVAADGSVAAGATDSGSPVKVGAVYNTTKPTYTNGQRTDLQADVNGALDVDERYAPQAEDNTNGVIAQAVKPLATSTYSWTKFQNLGANATLNVKASAGNVRSVCCHNTNAAVRYIQLHNTATTPAGGAVPVYSFIIPATSGMTIVGADFFGDNGANFTTGIAFAVSTTRDTYTAATAGDHATFIQYA